MRVKREAEIATVDMLRAFVSLSESQNLTRTSEELGVTRQTIRRHIKDLETIKGEMLFDVGPGGYALTQFGTTKLGSAKKILRDIKVWARDQGVIRRNVGGLDAVRVQTDCGRLYVSHQHPINKIAASGLPLMQAGLASWGQGQTHIEHPAMVNIRPYLLLYRRIETGWICVEVGEKSAYARWFGWAWSKSAIGRLSEDDKVGDDFNGFIADAYAEIHAHGGVRLDHLYAHLPRGSEDQIAPVSFQRLLMGCVFPDGTPALAVLAVITDQVDLGAFEFEREPMPKELIMDGET